MRSVVMKLFESQLDHIEAIKPTNPRGTTSRLYSHKSRDNVVGTSKTCSKMTMEQVSTIPISTGNPNSYPITIGRGPRRGPIAFIWLFFRATRVQTLTDEYSNTSALFAASTRYSRVGIFFFNSFRNELWARPFAIVFLIKLIYRSATPRTSWRRCTLGLF